MSDHINNSRDAPWRVSPLSYSNKKTEIRYYYNFSSVRLNKGFAVFPILYYLVEKIQPVLVPICFVCAWIFMALLSWSLIGVLRDAISRSQQMHSIPCTRCQYFTNEHRLKCTAQPTLANTEQAIGCRDYQPISNPYAIHSKNI